MNKKNTCNKVTSPREEERTREAESENRPYLEFVPRRLSRHHSSPLALHCQTDLLSSHPHCGTNYFFLSSFLYSFLSLLFFPFFLYFPLFFFFCMSCLSYFLLYIVTLLCSLKNWLFIFIFLSFFILFPILSFFIVYFPFSFLFSIFFVCLSYFLLPSVTLLCSGKYVKLKCSRAGSRTLDLLHDSRMRYLSNYSAKKISHVVKAW